MKIDLNRIAFIGRTFHEYSRMFDLESGLLNGKVLDCSSLPADLSKKPS